MNVGDNNTLLDTRTSIYKTTHLLTDPGLVPVILLIIVSFTINMIIIITYLRHPRLHTPNNIHVVSLAAADALVSSVSMPITAIRMSRKERLVQRQ